MTTLQIIVLAYVAFIAILLTGILWLALKPTAGEQYLKWVESLPLLDQQETTDGLSARDGARESRRAPSPRHLPGADR